MTEDRKTWLIEPGDVMEVMNPNKKQPTTGTERAAFADSRPQALRTAAVEYPRPRPKPAAVPRAGLQFAPLALLTYLLGPLALLLTPGGRRRKPALAVAVLSVAAALILVVGRFGVVVGEMRPGTAWLWSGLLALAVIGGFSVWALAVHQLGVEGIPSANRLPRWARRGWFISAVGLIAPGSGLLLRGHVRRATLVLWCTGPTVAAFVVLANARGLWHHHQASGWLATAGPTLEYAFMTAAALAVFGSLGHIAQALEGMRQFMIEPGLKTRVKGDYYALAVVAAVVTLVVVASPAQMARQMDAGSDILRQEGMQSIPLALTLAAGRLDPGTAEYSLQAIEIYAELGRDAEADLLRRNLDQNLEIYLAHRQRETVEPAAVPAAEPASRAVDRTRPAADLAPQYLMGTMSGIPTQSPRSARPDTAAVAAPPAPAAPVDSTATPAAQQVTRALGLPLQSTAAPAADSPADGTTPPANRPIEPY